MGGSSATAPRTRTGPSSSSSRTDLRLNILGKLHAARALALTPRGDPLEHLHWLESGDPFEAAGVTGLLEDIPTVAALARVEDVHAATDALSRLDGRPLDEVFMRSLPRAERHHSGAYFTPPWLAEHVLDRAGLDGAGSSRMLDPMCGAGVFLAAALRRLCAARPDLPAGALLERIAGVDSNPVSVLAARAACLGLVADRLREPIRFPIHVGDAISGAERIPLPEAGFDIVAGNPPWIGWESLAPGARARTRPLWERHGLFTPAGRDAAGKGAGMGNLLGRGRKDLCMLATYAAADRWLRPGGRLSFVISQTVFKSVGSAAGFRRFQLGDGTPLGVVAVDDLSERRVFANAAARPCVLTLEKGRPTSWPVPYVSWGKSGSPRQEAAEPIDPGDAGSAWITAAPRRLAALRRILGPSPYRARAGAYTGGANGIYWVKVIERYGDGTALVRNLPEAGKRMVPRVEARVEWSLLYPLMRASEVSKSAASPGTSPHDWILLPQDPGRRRGLDEEVMRQRHPLALAWLERFRAELAQRRDRGTRSLIESGAPFYTIFSVSRDTLAPWKVVWARIASRVRAVAVGPVEGRPVVPQETCSFIPCQSAQPEMEAHFLAGMLSSPTFNEAAAAFAQVGGKSFGAPHLLRHIAVPRFDAGDRDHQNVAEQTRLHHDAGDLESASAAIWSRLAHQSRG